MNTELLAKTVDDYVVQASGQILGFDAGYFWIAVVIGIMLAGFIYVMLTAGKH